MLRVLPALPPAPRRHGRSAVLIAGYGCRPWEIRPGSAVNSNKETTLSYRQAPKL